MHHAYPAPSALAVIVTPVSHLWPLCRFMEDCYLLPDPNAVRMHPLCLGSHCALCGGMVCAGDACSLFYAKRFCARWDFQGFTARASLPSEGVAGFWNEGWLQHR